MQIKIKYHVKEIRCQRNLSLRQMEYLSGVSKSQISAIENNQCDPSVATLCMLAEALGESVSNLFSYSRF